MILHKVMFIIHFTTTLLNNMAVAKNRFVFATAPKQWSESVFGRTVPLERIQTVTVTKSGKIKCLVV